MAVPEAVLEAVLAHFVRDKGLRITGRRKRAIDEFRAYFIWRRAATLGDAFPSWVAEAGTPKLIARIASEYQAVEDLTTALVGTLDNPGPLLPVYGGTGDVSPPHLDLADLARRSPGDSATSRPVRTRARFFERLRKARVRQILWRAAALPNRLIGPGLDEDIWEAFPNEQTGRLRLDNPLSPGLAGPMTEMVDRRLRAVEWMHYTIANRSREFGGMGPGRWNATGAKGPWLDGFRIRIFEYPRFPAFLQAQIGAANITDDGGLVPSSHDPGPGDPPDPPHPGTDQHWQWSEGRERLEWHVIPPTADSGAVRISGATAASDVATFTTATPHGFAPGFSITVYDVEPAAYNGAWTVDTVNSTTEFTAWIGATPGAGTSFGVAYRPIYAWRLPPALRSVWRARPGNQYRIDLVPPAGGGAAAIDALFDYHGIPRTDVWTRSWLWCDHVIAACNIEALLFGLRRRLADGEDRFNALVDGTGLPPGANPPYVGLVNVVGSTGPANKGTLMAHDNDPHFENTMVALDDLQVGDQLIFWNHVLYNLLSTGDWRLENALVMSVESEPRGKTRKSRVLLQGHGTPIRSFARYQQLIAAHLAPSLARVREKIRTTVAANASVQVIQWQSASLVRWSPYGNFRRVRYPGHGTLDLGAWWVEIPLSNGMTTWASRAEGVAAVPKSVAEGVGPLAAPAAGYTPPPNPSSAIYFPLFEPRMSAQVGGKRAQGWDAYLARRQTQVIDPVLMEVVHVSAPLIPGLLIQTGQKLAAMRPKPIAIP